MNISNITAAANSTPTTPAAGSSAAAGTSGTSGLGGTGSLTNEGTFLQLLIAQIKNQDPLNPTDSVQFVGQLVQFSQLEQLLTINQNLGTLVSDQSASGATTGSTTTGGTNPTNGTN